ncbi:MAG: hypothetical protein ACI35V_03295 [Sphingobacterium composti]|uniref:hypothetical protein n=1 Tax=Sphingobacterium composti TaxID=363260 RepID=UPI00135BB524|nr:hypothetical protein [Sphingobacterium composti Ten et al. 2007 non Yoo et al. 2007]
MRKILGFLKIVLSFAIFVVCFSCIGDNTSSDNEQINDSIAAVSTLEFDAPKVTLWTYDADLDTMVKNTIPADLTIELVIDTLNNRYANAKLKLDKIASDTVFVKIDDVSFLQQYGTTGNYGFMSEVVFSLTEVPDVNYVFLDFEEIDHASPGLYSRKNFENKIIP